MLRLEPILENQELETKETPPATTPSVQLLDPISFEKEFQEGKAELVNFNFIETPETLARVARLVPSSEKRHIMATYTISSLGLGLSCTIGILLKFTTPLAFGGAAFTIATGTMIGLTAGGGLLAIGLAFFVHKFYTKEAIKNMGILLSQLEQLDIKIKERASRIIQYNNESFSMLLQMKLASEQLKFKREQLNPLSSPSPTEKQIEARIDNYINFLVKHPAHPNFNQINDCQLRENEINGAHDRQQNIRAKLTEACTEILSNKTTVENFAKASENYTSHHTDDIRSCFPSLAYVAPKTKLPTIINKPAVGFAFLGSFSGTVGLSYLSLAVITAFATLPMAFPALYLIIPLAFAVATSVAYTVYKTKNLEAERNTDKKNKQKQLSYYYRNTRLQERRLHQETRAYCNYEAEVISSQLSPKTNQPTVVKRIPSFPNLTESGLSMFSNNVLDFNASSNHDLKSIPMEDEDLSFRDPSQFTSSSCSLATPYSPRAG
jgi:cell division protein FtsL